jgi:Predicted glycosyltransferases
MVTRKFLEVAFKVKKMFPSVEILIIDDGSKIEKLNFRDFKDYKYIKLPDNYGLGVCTHIALDYMIKCEYDILVRLDADGQHPIKKIRDLITPIQENMADIVVGCRKNHYKQNFNLLKNIIKIYYNFVSRIITNGKAPKDINSGFFAINTKAALHLEERRLERYPEPEIYIYLCMKNLIMKQIFINQKPRILKKSTIGFINGLQMFYRFNIYILTELIKMRRQ